MGSRDSINRLILQAHPTTQAIYRFGTWGTAAQRADSDVDVAVLLPHVDAAQVDRWQWHLLAVRLAGAVGAEHADVINLRRADTTLQHADVINLRRADTTLQAEILRTGRLTYCRDDGARLEFETLILSMYQKLNDERAGIRETIIGNARALTP